MKTETAIIERMTLVGRHSNGDSDIQAQTQLIDAGYRIVEVRTHGDDFIFIGERPYEAGMFEVMGERRLSHLSFNYGDRTIGAFDFNGELVAEAETLQRVFELASTAEGAMT